MSWTAGLSDHFVSVEERLHSPRMARRIGGRSTSPSHSAHGSLLRHSILKLSENKRAKKVRFYRNGDRFFQGLLYAVSTERFRTFESLLAELTLSPVGDKTVLHNGVRFIFSLDGQDKITSLEELQEGESYVCASTEIFRSLDYIKSSTPTWNPNIRTGDALDGISRSGMGRRGFGINDIDKDLIKPKLITVIRNGSRPRKAVRILLNKKTAHSFGQVLDDITEAIKLDSGAVRKLYTADGKQVTTLLDFFADDSVFIAYGPEKYAADDFDLDDTEVRFVSAYRACPSPKPERHVLRSPKSQRKPLSVPPRLTNGINGNKKWSPKSQRRQIPPTSPSKGKLMNGHGPYEDGDNGLAPLLKQRYEIGRIIGEGNFAVVRECVERSTRKKYALKVISKQRCRGKEQMIENEVCLLRQMKHPNIILLVDELDSPDELCLIMELVHGGDLFDAITTSTKYTERDASGMVFNLASALSYLHELNIVHRDVKPENLLVCEFEDGSKALKLGDFGLAVVATEVQYAVCGTPTYVAPEILNETGYSLKVDVWAAGVITYILLCGFPPFVSPNNEQEELFDLILSGEFEFISPFWDDISDSAKDLITQMLQLNTETRFSADDVINHPWVAEDMAHDKDMHTGVSKEISAHFARNRSDSTEPSIAIIASTALDKASRYFQGPRSAHLSLAHSESSTERNGDEVF